LIFKNSIIQLNVEEVQNFYRLGPLNLKSGDQFRYCSDGIKFRVKNKKLQFTELNTSNHDRDLILIEKDHNIEVRFKLANEISEKLLVIEIFSKNKDIRHFIIELNINFDKGNLLDYVALSGNLYKNVKKEEINLKVNEIGAFSGIFSACSKDSTISFISTIISLIKTLHFEKNRKTTKIVAKLRLKKRTINQFYIYLGNGDYLEPVKLKFLNLSRIIPLRSRGDYLDKAIKAHYTLKNFFSYKTDNGLIPANFIHYPMRKKDSLLKSPTCSYGNCFSLGAIYGTSALYLWTKDPSIKETLTSFINPVIEDAQIKEGPTSGAFYDTYSPKIKKWQTGRVQFKEGGFSDWMPYMKGVKESEKSGKINYKDVLNNLKRDFLVRKSEFLEYFIWALKLAKMALPYMKLRISKPVIFPAYTGQFAYFLFQTLMDSQKEGNFLGKEFEEKIAQSLELSAQFLVKTQKKNNIWDHELYIDGTIFWNKETLACIFPTTFLIWYGKKTENQIYYDSGIKALERCNLLQQKNEYYGMYYETDLSINQADLVTALACIKCYCKLYEIFEKEDYLIRAKKAAWHVISSIWSNLKDKKGNVITGGLLVTTYKGLGFPVIGGSELCQTFEVFCELSKHDSQFLPFAQALLGFCEKYLIFEGEKTLGIYEIIFGYSDNWSTSCSADFASYASGPFIRGLYLLDTLTSKK
jgi:hypothetical protein